jgi:hypothetical protein
MAPDGSPAPQGTPSPESLDGHRLRDPGPTPIRSTWPSTLLRRVPRAEGEIQCPSDPERVLGVIEVLRKLGIENSAQARTSGERLCDPGADLPRLPLTPDLRKKRSRSSTASRTATMAERREWPASTSHHQGLASRGSSPARASNQLVTKSRAVNGPSSTFRSET